MTRIVVVLLVTAAVGAGQTPPSSQAEMERFLKTARIVETKELVPGFPQSRRVVLDDGKMKHDAHIQTVNVTRDVFESPVPKLVNVRDVYLFNIAAYELGKILGINMIPPSVEREVDGVPAAVTWWVDDVLMDFGTHLKKKIPPPDIEAYRNQMYVVRVFDQLIFNTNRNWENLLISKDWKFWMIDHTRSFRLHHFLAYPKNLTKCDRKLLQRLRTLNEGELSQKLRLNPLEIEALLARRDAIVAQFERLIAEKGEQAVLYDMD